MSIGWRRWPVATAAMVLLVAGCSIGDIRRRTPAAPEPSAPASTLPASQGPDEVRRVRVPVPADFDRSTFEFTDAVHGYALFTRCGAGTATGGPPTPTCTAILLATSDGGRSWQKRTIPQPVADNPQLYAGNGALLLLMDPHGWYLSADGGETFEHRPGRDVPAEYRGVFGRFQVCCDSDAHPQLFEYVGAQRWPFTQPPVPQLTSVAYTNGRLVAAGLRDGLPYAAVWLDEERAWRSTPVPAPDGRLARVEAEGSRGDAWLIGYAEDRTTFPQLWRNTGDRWERIRVANHPERVWSIAPLGAGMAAVSGPRGSGVIAGETYNDPGWPSGADYLCTLDDGTLFGVHDADGSVWLAPGFGAERQWIKLVLTRM